ncbi:MAG: hypothetical protein ACYDDA_13125 [Acidiferrobacteraceae bacterium]
MSKLKDKLSANMRNVRENPQPTAGDTGRVPGATRKLAPKASMANEKPADARPAAGNSSGEVPESGTELFPARVWPD